MKQKNLTRYESYILYFMVLIVIAGMTIFFARLKFQEKTSAEEKTKKEETKVVDEIKPGDAPIISPSELYEKITQGDDFLLIDVQRPEQFAQKHIPGAINIPHYEIADRQQEIPRDKPVVVTCSGDACGLSVQAGRELVSLGFTNIYNMKRGVIGWEEAGYPTVSGTEVTYKNITVDQLKEKINNKDDIIIVDVREKTEYEKEHISAALWISFVDSVANIKKEKSITKDKEIIIYDQTGLRSRLVTEQLVKAGYLKATNMLEGFGLWKVKGYPVE